MSTAVSDDPEKPPKPASHSLLFKFSRFLGFVYIYLVTLLLLLVAVVVVVKVSVYLVT